MSILTKSLGPFGGCRLRRFKATSIIMQSSNKNTHIHDANEDNSVDVAAQYLRSGKVIALPTDTVYGLACDANNESAIKKLYAIKGRDFHKPVAICVRNLADLRKYGRADHLNDSLLEKLLPGPITIVIERSKYLSNPFLNPSTSKIGIRIPNFKFIQELCNIYNEQPLALTSANRSSEKSSLNIEEFESLWPSLGGIFDSGTVGLSDESRSASTVVDLSAPGIYKIVREGVALKYTLDVLNEHGLESLESLGSC
ncbi:threonyl-carbamoyl synthesis 1 [Musca autumnalis]|uniref:threonyl-carbamoyl synthesis 1 n=1 Tax=Musca autumnalis TaxID=221902 RepID=UPI003CF2F8B5